MLLGVAPRRVEPGPRRRPNMMAIATLSRTVIDANGRGIWYVRATPTCAIRCGGSPPMLRPSDADRPAARPERPGHEVDERRLARAVRPDQARPARRSRTVSETPSRARTPPKRLATSVQTTIGSTDREAADADPAAASAPSRLSTGRRGGGSGIGSPPGPTGSTATGRPRPRARAGTRRPRRPAWRSPASRAGRPTRAMTPTASKGDDGSDQDRDRGAAACAAPGPRARAATSRPARARGRSGCSPSKPAAAGGPAA